MRKHLPAVLLELEQSRLQTQQQPTLSLALWHEFNHCISASLLCQGSPDPLARFVRMDSLLSSLLSQNLGLGYRVRLRSGAAGFVRHVGPSHFHSMGDIVGVELGELREREWLTTGSDR